MPLLCRFFHARRRFHETANPRQPHASALRHGLGRSVRRPERGHELCRTFYHAGNPIFSFRSGPSARYCAARQKGNLRPPGRKSGKAAAAVRRDLRRAAVHGKHHPAVWHHPHHGRKIRLHHDNVHYPRSVSGAFREAACQAHELGLRGSGAYGSLSSVRRRRGVVRGEHRRLADASVRGFLRLPHSLY